MTRRPFRRAGGDARRAALIRATLDCIAERGAQGATVREIAESAGVTAGLIRHYFATKDHMVHAAYRETIETMAEMAKEAVSDPGHDAKERLARFVRANLTPPVVDERTLSLWAAFIGMIRVDPEMAAIHREGYLAFRHELERLVGDAFAAAGTPLEPHETERLAVTINAVIDGLWLEGSMADAAFGEGELATLGIGAVEAITGMKLQ